jgi:hypothetical protein
MAAYWQTYMLLAVPYHAPIPSAHALQQVMEKLRISTCNFAEKYYFRMPHPFNHWFYSPV